MKKWVDEWIGGGLDGWMGCYSSYEYIDGWMDAMDEWMDGWIN